MILGIRTVVTVTMKAAVCIAGGIVIAGLQSGCGESPAPKRTESLPVVPPKIVEPPPPPKTLSRFALRRVPDDMRPLNAQLGESVLLLGYTTSADIATAGGNLVVTWYWQALKDETEEWEYFTHLVDKSGKNVKSQNSSGPFRLSYKPNAWKPGEILKDEESIHIPKDWSDSIVELRTGLWRGPERMPVRRGPGDEQNRVKGPVITIAKKTSAHSQVPPLSADIPHTSVAPQIDGDIDTDPGWQTAVPLSSMVDSVSGNPVRADTRIQLSWDATHLYVAAVVDDDHLTCDDASHRDTPNTDLWKEDALTILVRPSVTADGYFEIQVSPDGRMSQRYFEAYRVPGPDWACPIRQHVVPGSRCDGPLWPQSQWRLEMAIPAACFRQVGVNSFDAATVIHANFFRTDKRLSSIEFASWSPPLRGDFHALDRLGQLRLVQEFVPQEEVKRP